MHSCSTSQIFFPYLVPNVQHTLSTLTLPAGPWIIIPPPSLSLITNHYPSTNPLHESLTIRPRHRHKCIMMQYDNFLARRIKVKAASWLRPRHSFETGRADLSSNTLAFVTSIRSSIFNRI